MEQHWPIGKKGFSKMKLWQELFTQKTQLIPGFWNADLKKKERKLHVNVIMHSIPFSKIFFRLTFALLEDTGWYQPNYEYAHEISWGRGMGCEFAQKETFLCDFHFSYTVMTQKVSYFPLVPKVGWAALKIRYNTFSIETFSFLVMHSFMTREVYRDLMIECM